MILEARYKATNFIGTSSHRLFYINGKLMCDIEESPLMSLGVTPALLGSIEECIESTKKMPEGFEWTILKESDPC